MTRSLAFAYVRRVWAAVLPRLASWRDIHQSEVSLRGPGQIRYGSSTYWSSSARFIAYRRFDMIEIGDYCSIAPGVRILAGGDHELSSITTYPLCILGPVELGKTPLLPESVRVGSDVWIGTNALILGGTVIGDGAIVGAGSVVTRDVPAYAVAVGAPAKVVRYRFPEEERELLLDLRWWDWPVADVRQCAALLQSRDTAGLSDYAANRGLPGSRG